MKLYADTKFEVGQTVYRVYETRKNIEQKATCDVCLGTGKITYKGYRCNCPKCNGRGELVTDSKEVTLREIDVPRKVTAIRLIADKNKDGLLRYTLDAPQGYCRRGVRSRGRRMPRVRLCWPRWPRTTTSPSCT